MKFIKKNIFMLCMTIGLLLNCIYVISDVTSEDIRLKFVESNGRDYSLTINHKYCGPFEKKVKERAAFIFNLWNKMGYSRLITKNKLMFVNPNTSEQETYIANIALPNLSNKSNSRISKVLCIKWSKVINNNSGCNIKGKCRKRKASRYKSRKHGKLMENGEFYIADTTYFLHIT